ncbi:MAG: ABC transporter ATP-binding protein/permease [Prevotella sp.]|nr:ABC transporter ATP-binding protein/permease [Prevotella sp.]
MFASRFFNIPKSRYGTSAIIKWLWRSLKGNRLQTVLNTGLDMLNVTASLLSVWAMQRAIDIAAGARQGNLYLAVAVMGALIISGFAIRLSLVWISNILGVKAQNRMQRELIRRLLRSEWMSLQSRHSGDVINRLELDVRTVVNFITEILPATFSTALLFIGAFTYMFCMDRWLAVVTIAIIPIALLFSRMYVGRMRQMTSAVRISDSEIQSLMQETVQQRTLIKSLEGDGEVTARLEEVQRGLRDKVRRRTKFSIFSYFVLNFGFATGYLIAFLWGALRLAAQSLSFGGMVAFLQLVSRLQNPARNMAHFAPSFVAVYTAAERLMEIEEDPLEEQGEAISLPAPCGIKMTNVSFAYGDKPIINNLSFDFRSGKCTAVIGPTGAGKTTILRLLLALVHPSQGTIEIYSSICPATDIITARHRSNFVYVPQGNTLLSGTIRTNLLLADHNATEEMMTDALKRSCADFVFSLPQGLDTPCSEQGGGLSEGQCQRISIARALLRGRSIMLFDEATSALDPATERRLLTNILASKGHTIIFITHRPAALDYADAVLRL